MVPISKGKFNNRQWLLILILFAMMSVISFYIFQHAFAYQYVQVDVLVSATSLTIFFFFILLITMQGFKAVDIYEDQLTVKWRFTSRIVNKSEITAYGITTRKQINYIIMKTTGDDVVLPELLLNNHEELIHQLQHWRIKQKSELPITRDSRFENRGTGTILMIVGSFLLGFTIKSVISPEFSVDGSKLITLSGQLSMAPEVKMPSGKNAYGAIQLYLVEYPGINFLIDAVGFNSINARQLQSAGKGTPVELSILKHEYAVKIKKTEAPGYFETHYQWATIYTYSLTVNSEPVLTVDTYNESKHSLDNSNKKWSVLIAIIAISMFTYGFILYRQRNKMPLTSADKKQQTKQIPEKA
ncbi:hypothetical protein A4H97_25605 [Niastella yeongjuensis]|uniref:Uncharacterized protein n=1 Tax=Niastella yeongjuensis TaxID=354355 RepID=A0A1V9F185_9BACT|nr:hypothetical protein [Niastella yeongjuensis]OQP51996.1 hypothetical protein A4H97_25605 [Niastella yeongjuensis]SEP36269.1 hypothetical protein SAMN05660816_05465 [Niastella yeongjuensis]